MGKPEQEDSAALTLAQMLDERADLRIRISLMENEGSSATGSLANAKERLIQIEDMIRRVRKADGTPDPI